MGFQTREFLSFFSKHFKQNIIVLEFEIKLFSHCFVAFEDKNNYCKWIIDAPIAFWITQNGPKMKKIWGFKLKRFKVFFQNI